LRDKESGKSRAFGFVTFACTFMAEAALEATEHIIGGRKVEPRLAEPDLKKLELSEPEYMLQV
jgi:RNA recognition motif-containing protein